VIKELIKRMLPAGAVALMRRARLGGYRWRNRKLSEKELFTRIYSENEWGGKPGEFCSGSGSEAGFVASYADMVRSFIGARGVKTVVDLGCGDFVVGEKLQMPGVRYVGVDIVDALIDRNTRKYGGPLVTFRSLNIVADELPDGDLCLIRQVLQHLSNEQIAKVLKKLSKYRFVIVTEHYPAPSLPVVPNRDKPHGGDTRILDDSAVYLEQEPFNMRGGSIVLEVEADEPIKRKGEVIRSYLLTF
jgi:SAM-dependent methyltransferase